ncbi:MAG: response regulator [Flavisolibacter sp.]|jgi:DNA-binding NtrC family response regulator|nr:response regulator [Flavisolibacter sp.]
MEKKIRLLIVDDDADDSKFFVDAVKEIHASIDCSIAKDGQQAMELLKNTTENLPDYIFLDLKMPRYNGRKCLVELKSDPDLKHIPVFIYTTSREVEESAELKSMGAIHFISKPTDPEEIYYVISHILEEQLFSEQKD